MFMEIVMLLHKVQNYRHWCVQCTELTACSKQTSLANNKQQS